MNSREIMNSIPDVIAGRETSPTDKWVLMILDNKIQCIATENLGSEGFPLITINMKHVNQGLAGREWDKVQNRIDMYGRTHPDIFEEPPTPTPMKCLNCGCTEDNCQTCSDTEGYPCTWVAENKCSRCYYKNGNLKKTAPDTTAPEKTKDPKNVVDTNIPTD